MSEHSCRAIPSFNSSQFNRNPSASLVAVSSGFPSPSLGATPTTAGSHPQVARSMIASATAHHSTSTHSPPLRDHLPGLCLLVGGEHRDRVAAIGVRRVTRFLHVRQHARTELAPRCRVDRLAGREPLTRRVHRGPQRRAATFSATGNRRETHDLRIGQAELAGVRQKHLGRGSTAGASSLRAVGHRWNRTLRQRRRGGRKGYNCKSANRSHDKPLERVDVLSHRQTLVGHRC